MRKGKTPGMDGRGFDANDLQAVILAHPNLSETQLHMLLDHYSDVIKDNPNLVKRYGALAVFQEFIALSAYDAGHGGNYVSRNPSKESQLDKGIGEAMTMLGVMEQGKVLWPILPSIDPKYEGTDPNGQRWDVKTPQLTTPKGKYIFDAAKEVGKMKKDFDNGENIIVNTKNITPKEIQELYEQLKANGSDGRSVWWPIGPSLTPQRRRSF